MPDCDDCGEEIWFVRNKGKKLAPVSSHYLSVTHLNHARSLRGTVKTPGIGPLGLDQELAKAALMSLGYKATEVRGWVQGRDGDATAIVRDVLKEQGGEG